MRACKRAVWIFITVKTGLKEMARSVRKRGVRQMTFPHITQKSAQLTHTEENKKSMKMIGPWRGWERSGTPKRGLSYCV